MSPNRFDATITSNWSGRAPAARRARRCGTCPSSTSGNDGRHRLDPLVPVRHRDRDSVGLRGRGQMPAAPRARAPGQLERVAQDPVDADPGHHRLLEHDLALGAGEHPAADRRVLALGVLADDDEVDVPGTATGQRRADAGHQPHRAAARRTGRTSGGTRGSSPTARCGPAPCRASRRRRTGSRRSRRRGRASRRASSARVRGSSRRMAKSNGAISTLEAEASAGCAQHPQALGQHLLADSVPGDRGDRVPALSHPPTSTHH